MSARTGMLAAALLAAASCGAPAPAESVAPAWEVRVVVDEGVEGRAPRAFDVRVAPGSNALEATRAAVDVGQGWVCCSDEDVWSVDGLESDPARDGWWSWWLDGELGPGFAHQVALHDGAEVEWRFTLADPEGRGAEPVARVVALEPAACAALEAIGAGRNLVAHGTRCRLLRHAALPRLERDAAPDAWAALELDAVVDGPAPEGARTLRFAPTQDAAAWEALGELCGRRGAARAAYGASMRAR